MLRRELLTTALVDGAVLLGCGAAAVPAESETAEWWLGGPLSSGLPLLGRARSPHIELLRVKINQVFAKEFCKLVPAVLTHGFGDEAKQDLARLLAANRQAPPQWLITTDRRAVPDNTLLLEYEDGLVVHVRWQGEDAARMLRIQ